MLVTSPTVLYTRQDDKSRKIKPKPKIPPPNKFRWSPFGRIYGYPEQLKEYEKAALEYERQLQKWKECRLIWEAETAKAKKAERRSLYEELKKEFAGEEEIAVAGG